MTFALASGFFYPILPILIFQRPETLDDFVAKPRAPNPFPMLNRACKLRLGLGLVIYRATCDNTALVQTRKSVAENICLNSSSPVV